MDLLRSAVAATIVGFLWVGPAVAQGIPTGPAGTPSPNIVTVQGAISGGTPIPVTVSGGGGSSVTIAAPLGSSTSDAASVAVTSGPIISAINAATLTPPIATYQAGSTPYLAWGGTTNAKLTATAVGVATIGHSFTGLYVDNSANVAATYIQLFNTPAAGVTLGTTVPIDTFQVPAGGYLDDRAMVGIPLANDVTVAATTTATGASAPANAVGATIYIK